MGSVGQHEVDSKRAEIINTRELFLVVQDGLRQGRDVFIGDEHLTPAHHALYAQCVERCHGAGIRFASAIELPFDREEAVNQLEFGGFIRTMPNGYDVLYEPLQPAIDYCRANNIPVACVDDGIEDGAPTMNNHYCGQQGIKSKDDWMTALLVKAKTKLPRIPILGLIGGEHAQKNAVPSRLKGGGLPPISIGLGTEAPQGIGSDMTQDRWNRGFDYLVRFDDPEGVRRERAEFVQRYVDRFRKKKADVLSEEK